MAQSFPALNGVVATDSELLNIEAINDAAQALEVQGTQVLVLFVEETIGRSLNDAETYLDRAIAFYGLMPDDYDPDLFTLFIGTAPLVDDDDQRPLYIVYGEKLASRLEAQSGGEPFVETLQGSVIVPRLLEGNYTGAVVDGLNEVTAQLSGAEVETVSTARDDPQATETPPLPNARSTEERPRSQVGRNVWLLLILFGVLFFIYLARRVKKPPTRGVDARLKVLKGEVSKLLIDLAGTEAQSGHDPFLPPDPNAQTDMVLLTGLLQDERPNDLATLQAEYAAASLSLEQTSKAFETLREEEERLNRRSPDLDAYVARYEALLTDLKAVTAFTERLAGQWQALQNLTANLPQRLKKLRASLEGARTGMREQFLDQKVNTVGLFEHLETRFEAAVSSYQGDHLLRALREVEALEADIDALIGATGRLTGVEETLADFGRQLEAWRTEGVPPSFMAARVQDVKEQGGVALNLLEQADSKVVDAQLDEVEERLSAARADAEEHVALFKENSRRSAELKKIGEETKLHIERAALSFDLVDDFAPANWRDIRGNGSEAQKAADAAFAFWQQAKEVNTLDRLANVNQAAQALDAAETELRRAYTLTDAIETRLENLRAAQETARGQLDEVARDIGAHRERLSEPDAQRDVGSAPRENLTRAEGLVKEVRHTLLNETRPDWLSTLAKIQEADRLADLALQTIQEETAAMAQRRRILASEKTEAESSVKRIVQFVRTHKADLQPSSLNKVQQAVDTYRHAQEVESNAQNLSGDALATTLKEAAIVFDEAQRLAEDAFNLVETDFQTAETLRQDTAGAVAQTRASFRNLERFVRSSGLSTSMNASLTALENDLPRYDPKESLEHLQETLAKATSLEGEIERLHNEARRHVEAVQSAQRQERLRQLELARRRRAAQDARERSTWGSWSDTQPPIMTAPRRRESSVKSAPRPLPRAQSAPPIKLPKRAASSSGRSGGGWSGGGRKSGRGW